MHVLVDVSYVSVCIHTAFHKRKKNPITVFGIYRFQDVLLRWSLSQKVKETQIYNKAAPNNKRRITYPV